MKQSAQQLLNQMTQDEKISLLDGRNFWKTKEITRLGIGSIEVADGPYGLRKQEGISDHMGWNKSRPAVAYVSGPGMAASWDKQLINEAGKHLGTEARANSVDILLGPAVNIVRTPLCGRNFEYYSEDPCLTGKMASAYINGVQSQGVGACIKHFAANNQEADREYINAVIDERALREIYLAAFEESVKTAKPYSIMTALNKVNGEYCSENKRLITDILRNEWGFDGFTVSDWNGVNDRGRALAAGLDLEMPCSNGVGAERIMKGIKNGTVAQEDIDAACLRIIKAVQKCEETRDEAATWNEEEHNAFTRKLARQCMVLLKNQNKILPLNKNANLAVVGEFAMQPRFQMSGSALVNPTRYEIPLDEIIKLSQGNVAYSKGCSKDNAEHKSELEKAVALAKNADVVIVMAGLPDGIEAEGRDRKNLELPSYHNELIEAVATVQPNTIVVLSNGSAVTMPWINKVHAIFECFLGGQCMAGAIADLLFGEYSPCAKLPISFPKALCNTPAYFNYPGYAGKVNYREEVFVGYRYYDTKNIEPLFCFGHGLSYTSFEYSKLSLSKTQIGEHDTVTVSVNIKNVGTRKGAEIVQFYVSPLTKCEVLRPIRELREFAKLELMPNEERTVSIALNNRAFSYYDTELNGWYAPKGEYEIQAASSSRDVRLTDVITYCPDKIKRKEITGWSTIEQLKSTQAGGVMFSKIITFLKENGGEEALKLPLFDESEENAQRINGLPLRMITLLSGNVLNNDIMDSLIAECNRNSI